MTKARPEHSARRPARSAAAARGQARLLIALLLLVAVAACNALFGIAPPDPVEDGAGGEGGDPGPQTTSQGGGPSEPTIQPGNPCPERGVIACVEVSQGASVARVRCDGEVWQTHDPCDETELCDPEHEQSGHCSAIPEECLGREPGDSFCEGAIRKTCGPTLLTVSQVTCPSVQLCTLGKAEKCASCRPNTYQCDGQVLKECNEDHTGYVEKETCTDPKEPCNEVAGLCSADDCVKGQKRCSPEGDVLEVCATNAEKLNTYTELQRCKSGLCDDVNKQCDECVPTTARCENGERISCATDGQKEIRTPCDEATPHCVGAGRCVQCTQKEQCTADQCSAPVCDSNSCSSIPAHSGDECSVGYCNASGSCVQCLDPSQCPVNNDCYTATCDGNTCGQTPRGTGLTCESDGGRFCDGSGSCVECAMPSNCSTSNDCYTATCDGNACGQTPRGSGLTCESDGGRFCNGSGGCVECVNPNQCSVDNDCYTPTCNGNACGQTPRGSGLTCESDGGSVCNGNGTCVACTLPGHCPQVTECFIRTCSNNVCGQSAKERAVACSGGNVCDGAGNCVPNIPYAVGESSATDWIAFDVPDDQWWVVPVTIPRTATLQAFRLIGESAGGQARMALWADDDGFPGAYVAQTNNFGMAQGVISQAPTTGTQLTGGQTYWVGAKFAGDASIFYEFGSGPALVLDQAFSAVPSTTLNPFPAESAFVEDGILFNFFLLLLDVPQ